VDCTRQSGAASGNAHGQERNSYWNRYLHDSKSFLVVYRPFRTQGIWAGPAFVALQQLQFLYAKRPVGLT
jgi:hypothetical protein